MNSEGGDIDAGIAMFNFLRLLPTKIITHNVGGVNSVANAMFLAGEHRLCNPSSAFGYHSSGFAADQNTRVDIRLVREWLEKLRVNNQRLATIFSERTSLSQSIIDDLFETEQIMPATWALDHGVVHEIKTFEIPDGSDWLAYAG